MLHNPALDRPSTDTNVIDLSELRDTEPPA